MVQTKQKHRYSIHVSDKNQLGTIGRKGGTVLPDRIRKDESGMELMEDYYDSPSSEKQKSLASSFKDVSALKNKAETRHNHAGRMFSTPTATYSKKSLNDSGNKSTKFFNFINRRATAGPLTSFPSNKPKSSFNEVISATQSALATRLKGSPTVLSDNDMFSHSVDDVSMDLTNSRAKSPRPETSPEKTRASFVNISPTRNGQLQDTSFLQISTEATKKVQNEYILSPVSNGKKMASSSVKPRLSTRMKSLNFASQNPTKNVPSLQQKENRGKDQLKPVETEDPRKKAAEPVKTKKIAQRTTSLVDDENDGLPLPVSRTGPNKRGDSLFAYTSDEEEDSPTEDLPKRKQAYASRNGRRIVENTSFASLQTQNNIPSTQPIRDDSEDESEIEIESEKVVFSSSQSNNKQLSGSQSKKGASTNRKRGNAKKRTAVANSPKDAVSSQKPEDNMENEIEFEEIEEEDVIIEKDTSSMPSDVANNLQDKEDLDSGLESEPDPFALPPPKPTATTSKAKVTRNRGGLSKQSSQKKASNNLSSKKQANKAQELADAASSKRVTSTSALNFGTTSTSNQKAKEAPASKSSRTKKPRAEVNESAPGLRRSGRVRMAPLQFWKNERILYTMEQDEESHTKVPGIKKVFHYEDDENSDKPAHITKRKTAKRKSNSTSDESDPVIQRALKRAKNLVKENSVSGLVHEYNSDGNITSERTEKMTLAWGSHISNNQFSSIPGSTHKLLIMYPNYNGTGTAAGMIVFDPNGEKPFKPSRETDYFFFVISGVVEANISENVISMGAGGSFRVPMGNYYSIKNVTDKEAKLFMVQAKDTAFSNALKSAREADGAGDDEAQEDEEENEE